MPKEMQVQTQIKAKIFSEGCHAIYFWAKMSQGISTQKMFLKLLIFGSSVLHIL